MIITYVIVRIGIIIRMPFRYIHVKVSTLKKRKFQCNKNCNNTVNTQGFVLYFSFKHRQPHRPRFHEGFALRIYRALYPKALLDEQLTFEVRKPGLVLDEADIVFRVQPHRLRCR